MFYLNAIAFVRQMHVAIYAVAMISYLNRMVERVGFHKTQKPLKVCLSYIEVSSKEGDLNLDPFIGSGGTAVACKMLKKNFIGFELNDEI